MTTPTLSRLLVIAALGALAAGCQFRKPVPPPTPQEQADNLARSVAMASGAAVTSRVTSASFNFVVREGDKVLVNRSHLWDVRAKTDTVSSGGEKPVVVDTSKPAPEDAAGMAAFKAWTNDTYWLAAPFKLFDGGVTREYRGRQEVAGKEYEVLRLAFKDVGMTPGDRYDMYIDPFTSLVAFWDYMPNADTTMRATWEEYKHPAGLKVSTLHHMGNKTITIENLSVTTE
jgi:hypothetical protein